MLVRSALSSGVILGQTRLAAGSIRCFATKLEREESRFGSLSQVVATVYECDLTTNLPPKDVSAEVCCSDQCCHTDLEHGPGPEFRVRDPNFGS